MVKRKTTSPNRLIGGRGYSPDLFFWNKKDAKERQRTLKSKKYYAVVLKSAYTYPDGSKKMGYRVYSRKV